MKLKFALVTFLLLFARGCDFYSTGLWFFDNPTGETNPLYQFFGFGWTGLVVVNIIIVTLIICALYYYCFRYKPPVQFPKEPVDYIELASLQYFNATGKFYQILYKIPKNKKVLLAHIGYVMAIVIIIASFLATFHNFCQYYNIQWYNQYRQWVGRPLYIIYGLILLAFILTYRHLLINKFKKYKGMS